MPQQPDFRERYPRNEPAITAEEQRELAGKTACVCGCGGIGGDVIELLARLGVGRIVAIDPDCFETSNLNRQLLSNESNLGQPKALAAKQRVAEINSQVDIEAVCEAISESNACEFLSECDIAIDALDSIETRIDLEHWCAQTGTPLVHGAIAGWNAQVTTIAPGSHVLSKVYPFHAEEPTPAATPAPVASPAFAPALVAAFEAAECAKVLLGKGDALYGKLLVIDLLRNTQRIITL